MELDLKDVKWGEFKINDIFNVHGTFTTHPSKLVKGGKVPRITCAATNNGFEDTYHNKPTEDGRVITIDSATIGYISYQAKDFIATDHVEKISLKNGLTINKYLGLFIVSVVKHCASNKYGYGYKFSQSRIKKQKISLPINSIGQPDYAFMEQYMRYKEQEKITKYNRYITKRIESLKDFKDVKPLNEIEWGEFEIENLFNVKIGKSIDGNKVDKSNGDVPYITRKESNNGLDGFINYNLEYLNISNPVITIGNETAEPFVQTFNFFTGTKVNILKPRQTMSKYVLAFICTSLRQHKAKYSYSFTINSTRLRKQKVLLPLTIKGQLDYDYMENYIKKLEYEKLTKYLAIKNKQ